MAGETTVRGIAEAAGRAAGVLVLAVALLAAARVAEVEVAVSSAGFRPAQLSVRKGETLRVRLLASDREHCFAIDALRIEKRVVPGKPTVVDVVAERAGTYSFHSCLEPRSEALRGRLVVTE
jgi:heme/copper-type cytochrome/quinol oxidase subunit 2